MNAREFAAWLECPHGGDGAPFCHEFGHECEFVTRRLIARRWLIALANGAAS